MTFDVYIIHAPEDLSLANQVRVQLKAAKLKCAESRKGDSVRALNSAINEISESQVIVFIFSVHANASQSILEELGHAFSKQKPVIQVCVDPVEPTATLEQLLRDAKCVIHSSIPSEEQPEIVLEYVRKFKSAGKAEGSQGRNTPRDKAKPKEQAESPVYSSGHEQEPDSRRAASVDRKNSDEGSAARDADSGRAQSLSRRSWGGEGVRSSPDSGRAQSQEDSGSSGVTRSQSSRAQSLERSTGRNSSPRNYGLVRNLADREEEPRSTFDEIRNSSRLVPSPPTPTKESYSQSRASVANDRSGKTMDRKTEVTIRRDPVSVPGKKTEGFFSRLFKRKSAQPATRDRVDCSIFAPPTVSLAMSFLVQVFAHCPEQAEVVNQLAKEFDQDADRRGKKTLEAEIPRGAKLNFHLVIPGLTIGEPVQDLTWWGNPESVQFEVTVPEDFDASGHIGDLKGRGLIGTVRVCCENIPVGHIKFKLKVMGSILSSRADLNLAGDAAHAYRKAFISYASQDRTEVLKRVQMLSRLNIEFFQDVLSLEPGARWEKELYRHIDESDLFLLFWSSNAKQSKWVLEEVRYALGRKGGEDFSPPEILPVIIEGPPPVEPPEELAHLHFNDYITYFLAE